MPRVIANDHAYSIEEEADTVRFLRRDRSHAWLAAVIAGGLAAVMAINGGVQVVLAHVTAGLVLLALGGGTAVVAASLWRRRRPPQTLVTTLTGGVLRLADGTQIAVDQLRVTARIDWMDGMGGLRLARILSVRWPKGNLAVFKSYDKREIEEVRRCLTDHGVGG